jgi:hypothetical protein
MMTVTLPNSSLTNNTSKRHCGNTLIAAYVPVGDKREKLKTTPVNWHADASEANQV